ncbi:hypothetical protein [Vibrio mediterranei]|uniref:hypothetical protein n=1 Tax=Vibrio mediterranei TaxID=689 RepID=UPI004068F03D
MTREELTAYAEETERTVMFADGFDNALLGYIESEDPEWLTSVYDGQKIIEILIEEGMDETEAIEFAYFNVFGSLFSKGTPVYINV